MPVDFTPKDNVHGLAYRGLDPRQALFGTSGEHFNLFGGGPEEPGNLLEDIKVNKGRKLGISGQVKVFIQYSRTTDSGEWRLLDGSELPLKWGLIFTMFLFDSRRCGCEHCFPCYVHVTHLLGWSLGSAVGAVLQPAGPSTSLFPL